MNRISLVFCAVLVAVSPQAGAQSGQAWPTKAARFITNYTPGGPTDLAARSISAKMQEVTGQSFLVENLPSANGVIGTQITARAAPDGHTLMLSTAGHTAIAASLYGERLPFDIFRDIVPISMLLHSNQLIIVNKRRKSSGSGCSASQRHLVTRARSKRFNGGSAIWAISRGRTSRSNGDGPMAIYRAFRSLPASWYGSTPTLS